MRYHVLHIQTKFAEEWQKDVFDQALCELGVDTIDGNDYYIQTEIWDSQQSLIQSRIEQTEGASLLSAEACPDENWNAVWEAEHPMQELPLGIKIIPHCAFGAGHHETTSMMINELINFKFQIPDFKFSVLDHGTGTGVLAIYAKRLGAAHVVAVDIDEKSVENARENAALNEEQIEVKHSSDFHFAPSAFHLILANIHRNILLEFMPLYADSLMEGGQLWLSGFYESDCEALIGSAAEYGLHPIATHANGEWRMIQLKKTQRGL